MSNEKSIQSMKDFIQKQNEMFRSYVVSLDKLNETTETKWNWTIHRLNDDRQRLNKFEQSLEWEDE